MSTVAQDIWEPRFWSRVNKHAPDGCWEWTGHLNHWGYGEYHTRDARLTTRFAHRIAWFLRHGSLPEFNYKGLELDHLCRNPKCCNPDHLEPVSHRENVMRSPIHLMTANAQATHCIRGHEFTAENTFSRPASKTRGPRRECRTCQADALEQYRARHRCSVPGCTERYAARELCGVHYGRMRRGTWSPTSLESDPRTEEG